MSGSARRSSRGDEEESRAAVSFGARHRSPILRKTKPPLLRLPRPIGPLMGRRYCLATQVLPDSQPQHLPSPLHKHVLREKGSELMPGSPRCRRKKRELTDTWRALPMSEPKSSSEL